MNIKSLSVKNRAPLVAGITAFLLANFKLLVGIISGSMSVLTSAVDSIMDFIISTANFIASGKAEQKADREFNYGYAKLEGVMSLLEGFFITGIGIFLVYASGAKIFNPPEAIKVDIAIYVMIFSLVVTGGLVFYLDRAYKVTNSLIIKADSLHYKTDFLTNLGIIVALLVIRFTGFIIIDAIFGFIIGVFIIISAFKLIKESVVVLIDRAVEPEILEGIGRFIDAHGGITSYHDLRTRTFGNSAYITAHLVFTPNISLKKAHDMGDEIENFIAKTYNQYEWDINLHFDPTDDSLDEVNK
ncbi:MAG: cation transporter [Campylobacter sp.]|nr:cation transporter [Campylobacter sp.]